MVRSLMRLAKKVNWGEATRFRNSGVHLAFRHTLKPLSFSSNAFKVANISQWRSITLVKNCLWWGFSFDTKKKTDAYNLWATIHSLYGERRRTCFAEAGFVFDHGSTGLRCFFTFEILRRCRNARESISNLCASHRGHRQASPLPYFPFL